MLERRFTELRAEGRRLSGVMPYGDVARLPWGSERFAPGAFGPDVGALDVILNVQHERGRPLARTGGGGLMLADGPRALEIQAELPRTRDADDALVLVRSGVLRGLSIEFAATRERHEGRVRVVEGADLSGLGVVDRPAYPGATVAARVSTRGAALAEVLETALEGRDRTAAIDTMARETGLTPEGVLQVLRGEVLPPAERLEGLARALGLGLDALVDAVLTDGGNPDDYGRAALTVRQEGEGLAGSFDYGLDTIVSDRAEERQRAGVRKQRVRPGAFRFALDDPGREINLTLGRSYDRPLASKQARTLELQDSERALNFRVERLPDTSYVRDFRAQLSGGAAVFGVAPMFRIPPRAAVPNAVTVTPEAVGSDVLVEQVNEAVLTGLAVVTRAPRGNPGHVARRRRVWL